MLFDVRSEADSTIIDYITYSGSLYQVSTTEWETILLYSRSWLDFLREKGAVVKVPCRYISCLFVVVSVEPSTYGFVQLSASLHHNIGILPSCLAIF